MNAISKVIAASAVTLAATLGAEAATVVTDPFFDTKTIDLASGNDAGGEDYLLSASQSFDVVFSGTGLFADIAGLSYSIFETANPGNVIAAGTFVATPAGGALGSYTATETFVFGDNFSVEYTGTGLSDEFSATFSIVSPSAVPLPAGVFLLGGALAALGVARRKA